MTTKELEGVKEEVKVIYFMLITILAKHEGLSKCVECGGRTLHCLPNLPTFSAAFLLV